MSTIGPDSLELALGLRYEMYIHFKTNILRSQNLKSGIPLKARLFAISVLYFSLYIV